MGGVYSLNEPGHRLGRPDKAQKFYPDLDGNFTDGIPGNPGDPFYERPAGFWDGGKHWSSTVTNDATQEYLLQDPTGKSTDGLIAEDGTVKTLLPPNSRSFILGPLVDGYVPNHGYDNYTNIGYLQKDTRQFVLLARIQGQFTTDLHGTGDRVWDGTSSQLTIYNSNFTLEMAEWFRDQIIAGTFTADVPYFYSGGVPQRPQTPASCPNCPPNMFGGIGPGTGPNIRLGQGTPPTLGSRHLNGIEKAGNQLQAGIFNLTPDEQRTVMNAVALGLDIAAVVSILFPEPGTTAAGATHLASKLRYASKFGQALKRLNPFKRSPKPKITYGKNAGKPSKVKYGDGASKSTSKPKDPMDQVLRDIDAAGRRLQQQPRGTNFRRAEVRGPYSDVKAQSRPGSGKYRSQSRNYDPKNNPSFGSRRGTRRFNDSFDYELYAKALECISEAAPTVSGASGGTEVADAYADNMSQNSSPEELETASNDANDIAKEGGQGLSDAELAKIDREAEAAARRMTTNIRISNPESMNDEQLFNAFDLIYDADEELTMELSDQFENLIDRETIDAALEDYKTRREYLSSEDYYRTFPGYAQNKDTSEYLWNSFMTYVTTVPDSSPTNPLGYNWTYNGRPFTSEDYGTLRQWSTATKAYWNIESDIIWPAKSKELDLAFERYAKISNEAFRPHFIAVLKAWNLRYEFGEYLDTIDSDPYSLKDIPRGNATYDAASELAMLGISAAIAASFVKAVGAASVAKLTSVLRKAEGIAKWYNKGRKPGEDKVSWRDLFVNDYKQMGKFVKKDSRWKDPKNLTDADFEGGPFPTNLDQLGQFVQGKGGITWSFGKGSGTGPTPVQRQILERPFKALMNLFQSYDPQGNLLSEETDDSLESSIDAALKETESLEDLKKVMDTFMKMMEAEKNKKEQKGMESYKPKFRRNRKTLTETRTPRQRRILREIKQPVKVKEAPTKYKMNFSGKYSSQNTPDKTASQTTDELVSRANARGQQWRSENKRWSGYETTERMNIIQDRTGHGKQAWDYMLDEGTKKSEWRTREVQEELNRIAHERAMLKENPDYISPFGNVEISTTEKNLQNFDRVTKIKKVVADTKVFNNKEIKPEYPEDGQKAEKEKMLGMVDKMNQQEKEYEGSKAQTGENAAARYKRLDPISAKSMPNAAYPQIDALRDQARKKPK